MFESNPIVPDYVLAANPKLRALHALTVFDRVVGDLTQEGLLVILDNHNSNAEWCCGDDGNDLWYNAGITRPIQRRAGLRIGSEVKRYRDDPLVVAVDLRNEPRIEATWGGDPCTDWHAAAERAGNAVLGVNPTLLVMVEDVNFSLDLTGVSDLPVQLKVANRVVYSPHDYPFDHNGLASSGQLASQLNTGVATSLRPISPSPRRSGWENSAIVTPLQTALQTRLLRTALAAYGLRASGNIFQKTTSVLLGSEWNGDHG